MRWTLLLVLLLPLAACKSPAPPVPPEDRTTTDPGFSALQIIEIAVLPPRAETPDRAVLEEEALQAARHYLIEQKSYAVPAVPFVLGILNRTPEASEPARAVEAIGSDAVLQLVIDQWNAADLLPRGRIQAGATARLYGRDGRIAWERTVRNRALHASGSVTASNRLEMVETMMRSFVTDLLSTLPAKRTS